MAGVDEPDEIIGYKDDGSSVLEAAKDDTECTDVSVGFASAVETPKELDETLENGVSNECSVVVPKSLEDGDAIVKSREDSNWLAGALDHVE